MQLVMPDNSFGLIENERLRRNPTLRIRPDFDSGQADGRNATARRGRLPQIQMPFGVIA